jgi:hypothetical protein
MLPEDHVSGGWLELVPVRVAPIVRVPVGNVGVRCTVRTPCRWIDNKERERERETERERERERID